MHTSKMSLNPCFSGGWSRRAADLDAAATAAVVLILVLVEDGLGADLIELLRTAQICLNPCFSGGWSRSAFA